MSTHKALQMLRRLPRLSMENIEGFPSRNRFRYHKKKYIMMPKIRTRYVPIGFELDKCPEFLKYPVQKGPYERFDISYVPLSMKNLQLMIDTGRLSVDRPVDITQLYNSGVIRVDTRLEHGGIMLEEEGLDSFTTPMNLEVQFASEACIAAIERVGGTVTTAYYDPFSLSAALNPIQFFKKGLVIPRRQLPPQRHIEYYSNPANRGYLADPEKIREERLKLSQKYGYELPDLSKAENKNVLLEKKDPRQIFYGLAPGWIVNLKDKVILKPTDPELKKYYSS